MRSLNEGQERGAACRKVSVECPAALDALKVGVVCCLPDEDLTFLWGNRCFYDSVGYSREEYQSCFCDLHQYYVDYPEEFAVIRRGISEAMTDGGTDVDLTVRLPLRAGGYSWVRLLGTLMENQDTGETELMLNLADVSALVAEKEEQARLHQQKLQYFHWMLDSYEGNIYVSDMDTYELLYLNRASCNVLGAPAEKLVGHKCYELIQGFDAPCPFCTNSKLCEESFYEWEFDNPNLGRTFMIKDRIIDWDGRRARLEMSHDMYSTEYKLAKKDRERDAVTQSIPGGFVRLDARDLSTVLWYGAGFLDMIEYTAEQFKQELHSQCTYVPQEDLDNILPALKEVIETGQDTVIETHIQTRTGKTKIVTMTFHYASAEDSWDGIPSFYSIGIDVTKDREEQARQRRVLEDAYEVARVSSDAKTNFLSSMSHDIRTPMNAIIGMTAIAQVNLNSPEKVQECLGKIATSSRHLLSLINEVLDMSKIESGKIDLVSEEVSFPELFQDVMDMCRPLAVERGQELQMSADHVRHENIVTDRDRLQQVLVNLLSNAVKYTNPGGNISLRVRELPSTMKTRGQYEFIVSDNGIGMSEEYIPHIFEPFSRAEDSRISKIQGTGLGMAITENIVRMMNGTIDVRSRLGEGSEFTVSVSFELCGGEELCDEELTGLSVLVVDDDPIVCESAASLLTELKMRGCWVLSGAEAVRALVDAHEKADDFFAVVLDWKMPDMDGLETVKVIREKLGMDVPIIIISAYDYSEIEEEFKHAGADAFITKPLFKSKMAHTFRQFRQSTHIESVLSEEMDVYFDMTGKRILLVEDNDLNREIAVELLSMQGFVIDEAENGMYAVEKFRASAPGTYDCILMDVQMPVMNGYEATKAIRDMEREDAKKIPILALTANVFASDLGKAYHAGMNEHIAKPLDIAKLLEAMQRWIR